MTATNTTPEGFRTAAYLATRARLDARKTSKSLSCNPPNTKCGGRCIPPAWDCRLKGEGPDPHLRAVKTDPLGGLASIERGIRRVTRGVTKGSFSEVEGGKKAIIRGAVKIAPGNLQQKKELEAKLENRTRAIGIGLAVVTGGLGIHAILMRGNTFGYRSGLGRDINNATRAGVARVLDAVPLLGAQRAATRAAVGADLGRTVDRLNLGAIAGPEVAGSSGIPRLSRLSASDEHSHSALQQELRRFNDETVSRADGNLTNWDRGHRAEFWKVERAAKGLSLPGSPSPEKISIFAEPSGQEFLATQFGLPASDRGSREGIKAGIEGRLREERLNLVALAKQRGFRTVNSTDGMERVASADLNRFIRDVSGKAPTTFYATRANVEEHIRNVLTNAPRKYTDTLYAQSVRSFDSYYKTIAGNLSRIPGATSVAAAGAPRITRLTAGSDDLVKNADNYRSAFLAREMNIRSEMAGPAHAELVRTGYYHNRVVGTAKSTYVISDRLAISAASELSGWSIRSRTVAIRLLNQTDGFATARIAAPAAPRAGSGAARQASLSALARRIMARAGNENMSMEAALRQARSEQRGDSAELPLRLRVYLEARRDFKEGGRLGKPCGASHIPKAYECSKGTAGSTQSSSDGRKKAAIVAAVVGGAVAVGVAGTVAYNLKTVSDASKTPLSASPDIRKVAKAMKVEAKTKSVSEAMGHYYVNKSGLKPGDVVYFRSAKDPSAHFGVYLGPGKDGIVRAVIANTKSSRFSWTDVAEIGSIKPGVKAAQSAMTPLVKAPEPAFIKGSAKTYTAAEIVQRAIRISNTDYKFSVTRDNCETLANTIAYGVPKSDQLNRLNRVTKTMLDISVGRSQRRTAGGAIYAGRAQGRNYTATEFSKFLEGERAFSSPQGKDLARQYDIYFSNYKLDAKTTSDYLGLVSPSELWNTIVTYEPAIRARAMGDYIFTMRTLSEMEQR